jgi:hypothetical protein
MANRLTIVPRNDLSDLQEEAIKLLREPFIHNTFHFSKYPYQLFTTFILYGCYYVASLLGCGDFYVAGNCLNVLCIILTLLGCYLSMRKWKGREAAILLGILFALNPLFPLLASYPYTYVICMPFMIWGGYFFVEYKTRENHRYVCLLLSLLLFLIGYGIRVVAVFGLIALLLCEFLQSHYRSVAIALVLFILMMVGGNVLYSSVKEHYQFAEDEQYTLPVTHWLMMGLNEGSWGGSTEKIIHIACLSTQSRKR